MSAFAECVLGQAMEQQKEKNREFNLIYFYFYFKNNALSAVEAHPCSYWTTRIPVSDISNKYHSFSFCKKKKIFFIVAKKIFSNVLFRESGEFFCCCCCCTNTNFSLSKHIFENKIKFTTQF
jgi:hypothetical protein